MCQAFAAEQALICSDEKYYRKKGFEAFQAGQDKQAVPKNLIGYEKESWELGFDIAEGGYKLF